MRCAELEAALLLPEVPVHGIDVGEAAVFRVKSYEVVKP